MVLPHNDQMYCDCYTIDCFEIFVTVLIIFGSGWSVSKNGPELDIFFKNKFTTSFKADCDGPLLGPF